MSEVKITAELDRGGGRIYRIEMQLEGLLLQILFWPDFNRFEAYYGGKFVQGVSEKQPDPDYWDQKFDRLRDKLQKDVNRQEAKSWVKSLFKR